MQSQDYEVSDSHAGKRLDAFLVEHLTGFSREKIKRAIQDGQCKVDELTEKSPATRLRIGQRVNLCLTPPTEGIEPEQGEIQLIWQDEDLLVCNKQAGITVHPCPSCPNGTYIQRLASHFPQILLQEGLRPGIVHRLDKDTSGIMLVALNEPTRLSLSNDFANRQVQKKYLALVQGVPPNSGEILEPIGRHPQLKVKMGVVEEKHGGRPAHSAWKTLYADPNKKFALVEVEIFTGRTHQIRVHMAHLGFPLWGDALYGQKTTKNENSPALRQMLHAWQLSFKHPTKQEILQFKCPAPQDMLHCAVQLSKKLQKIIIVGLPGCGKSTLLNYFTKLGLKTWSADNTVKNLYEVGNAGHDYFLKRFGNEFIAHKKAEIDRNALRKAMQDSNLRKEINTNIHSLVYADLQNFWQDCREACVDFGVAEVPLYLENGRHTQENAHIIGLKCPQDQRYSRMQNTRNWSTEQCESMDSWQWPEHKKMSICHTVLENTGTAENLEKLAAKAFDQLKNEQQEQEALLIKQLQSLWQ